MIFRRTLLLLVLFPLFFARADDCDTSVALLGSEPGPAGEAPREVVVTEIADLYSAALNERALMEAAVQKMHEFARREGRHFDSVMREIELLALSPRERQATEEERRTVKEEERSHLYRGLEPYLVRIGRKHRKIIEKQLIRRGLVTPLSTGEVEFRFQGRHTFLVGDEGFDREGEGKTKEVSFKPGDDFAIGQVPVTQFMYFLAALGVKDLDPVPSGFREGEGVVVLQLDDNKYAFKPNHPVELVTYVAARAHVRRVSKLTGLQYGLPSEIQWEFANRAGANGKYHFGEDEHLLREYGWFSENSDLRTHAVGQLLPNGFHLFDTYGNVDEWTSTWHQRDLVYRGGSWNSGARDLRSANREFIDPYYLDDSLGFRMKREIPGSSSSAHTFFLGESNLEAKPVLKKRGCQQ
jgi:hypothetical protein